MDRFIACCLCAVLLLSLPLLTLPVAAGETEALRAVMPQLLEGSVSRIGGATLARPTLLAAFYRQRDWKPLWESKSDVAALIGAIADIGADGLRPEDYHWSALVALANGDGDARHAQLDLLATDALAALAIDLHYGKTDPRAFDPDWNISAPVTPGDLLGLLTRLAESRDKVAAALALAPQHWFYGQLKKALAIQRRYAAADDWGTVAAGETLKPGMTDPRVEELRARLAASGEYTAARPDDPEFYDEALAEAVERFQDSHGLEPDGAVGRRTVTELDVTPEERVDQVRVNLERARWVLNQLGPEFIIVNISGFHLYVIKDGQPVWNTKVVVGRAYRQTPMFKSTMRSIVFNPTWTVPPTILSQDILPKLAKNRSYLADHQIDVIDSSGGTVDPASIDWKQALHHFRYTLVQRPGPDNSLGQVKFLFPNDYSIYLHDTPHKELFARAERAASSGCIRVEHPMELAYYLLAGDDEWPRERIDAAVAGGETQTVALKRRLPVVVMYWTAQLDRDGTMRFFPDLYGRDAAVLRALGPEARKG